MKLLVVGDSLVEFYDWRQRFPNHEVMNLGRAGETVQGLHGRIEAIIRQAESPDFVLIMSGTNNIVMEDFGFIGAFGRIIDTLAGFFPKALIFVTSLLPYKVPWLSDTVVPDINQALLKLCREKNINFLDIYSAFLKNNGQRQPDCFMPDGIHLSDKGYGLWADVLARVVNPAFQNPPTK